MDTISNIKKFIDRNLKDKDGGNWEYLYRPEIRYAIDCLNEIESQIFTKEILNWKEEVQFVLADEILFSKNEYIDKYYLYCVIFSKTTNIENGEYLLQNFIPAFYNLNSGKCSQEFFESIRKKVLLFSSVSFSQEHIFSKLYTEKMEKKNRE